MQFSHLHTQLTSHYANPNQVLFINQSGSRVLDDFFHRNLNEVKAFFRQHDKDFIFLPELLTPEYINDLTRYIIPQYPEKSHITISPDKIYELFLNFPNWRKLNPNIILINCEEQYRDESLPTPHTGLVNSVSEKSIPPLTDSKSTSYLNESTSLYNFSTLEDDDDEGIWQQLRTWERHFFPESFTMYSAEEFHQSVAVISDEYETLCNCSSIKEQYADSSFPKEAYQLSQEILERVEKLRMMGVNELIIKGLLNAKPQLSNLFISSDYRILLPEYQNLEIVMTPLVKAVYLLFLNHPEGILFKRIGEFKDELLSLYQCVSNREADIDMRKSVEAICNPLNNSLNEKCSRIREAFLREIDDTIACYYYITGARSTPKGIRLDRSHVHDFYTKEPDPDPIPLPDVPFE